MKRFFVWLWIIFPGFAASGSTEIMGLRVYANDDEYSPPFISPRDKLTIEFDVASAQPPFLQVLFQHASKDWVADRNILLADEYHTRSPRLFFSVAPNGVSRYTYHYKNTFPDAQGIVRFLHSGNYIFQIVDAEHGDGVLAEGRFIVYEHVVGATIIVDNRLLPETSAPFNQMHVIVVSVNADSPITERGEPPFLHQEITTTDIYQNWKLYNAFRIGVDDTSPDTFVEDFYLPNKKFTIRNVPPYNEYRRLDLSSVKLYPNNQPVRLVQGADLSRFRWQGRVDANGASKLRPFVGANSDYLDVEFRLELPSARSDIFLVGSFSRWNVMPEYRMVVDTTLPGLHKLHRWIRRGVYDYQYVIGRVDVESNRVVEQDWMSLEGNDWRTINRYTAVVYYRDRRFGGFDRIVAMATTKSPGGTEQTHFLTHPARGTR